MQDPEVRETVGCEARGGKGQEGSLERESLCRPPRKGENLESRKTQESKRPRPGLTLWVARKGYSFSGGSKPLRRRCKAAEVMQGSAGAERVLGNRDSITGEEWKALKGEAQGRWTLKDASKVRRANAAVRVAKP
jgi:hypothetical protein